MSSDTVGEFDEKGYVLVRDVLDAQTVRLRAGDVVVQRGTRHDWRNSGTEPCVIAFCLVGATRRS